MLLTKLCPFKPCCVLLVVVGEKCDFKCIYIFFFNLGSVTSPQMRRAGCCLVWRQARVAFLFFRVGTLCSVDLGCTDTSPVLVN